MCISFRSDGCSSECSSFRSVAARLTLAVMACGWLEANMTGSMDWICSTASSTALASFGRCASRRLASAVAMLPGFWKKQARLVSVEPAARVRCGHELLPVNPAGPHKGRETESLSTKLESSQQHTHSGGTAHHISLGMWLHRCSRLLAPCPSAC